MAAAAWTCDFSGTTEKRGKKGGKERGALGVHARASLVGRLGFQGAGFGNVLSRAGGALNRRKLNFVSRRVVPSVVATLRIPVAASPVREWSREEGEEGGKGS